ncbi:MAG: fructose-bisphosphatase class II [Zetaproteobacteria bacterium]|nr:fructose-bisphosphatase class II [Pseudobdellovibrionaceae bacterium]
MDRNLALEFVRVTEAAALACGRWIGRGDEKSADAAAVETMRSVFDSVDVNGTIVIGEGERDEAPMLYIGEVVGSASGPDIDIACDPLEGTSIVANGGTEALAVIAAAERGKFLHAPDTYMDKIAVGPGAAGVIDIRESPTWNIEKVAAALKKKVEDIVVICLDRPRHQELIREVRESGAMINLISDGDVSGAIATTRKHAGADILLGTGGAPEGVLAAAALRCLGGEIQGRLNFRNDEEKIRAQKMGITDFNKIYAHEELATGPVIFAATGVTRGSFLDGVQFFGSKATSHSIVMRSETGTIREIRSRHIL